MKMCAVRWGSAGLALLMLLGACASPSANTQPGNPPAAGKGAATSLPQHEARLLLDLAAGVEPDRPGFAPGRVGGVPPRGPLALAVDPSGIYLADQAKGRILQYQDGLLIRIIPAPWMGEQAVNLALVPEGLEVSDPYQRFTIDLTGRILEVERLYSQAEEERWITPQLGTDRFANSYVRSVTEQGTLVQRMAPDGEPLAAGLIAKEELADSGGDLADWFITADGGFYGLTWLRWPSSNAGVQVYEVLPPVVAAKEQPAATAKSPARNAAPAAGPTPPQFKGYPVPHKIRLFSPNWAARTIAGEVDLWNIWQLLARSAPTAAGATPNESLLARLEVTLPGPDYVAVDLYPSYAAIEGERYVLEQGEALRALLGALQHSSVGLTQALGAADRVWVESPDLRGVSQLLSAEQVAQLAVVLQQAYPVNRYTPPQPLEEPFPRYRLRLGAQAWVGYMDLRGDYLLPEPGTQAGTAAHAGGLADLVSGWLPMPALAEGSVEELYLAERLETGDGMDLTRWKSTVVRHLLGLEGRGGEQVNREPFSLTFYLRGEPRVVAVDAEGFTYAGQRFERTGLTDLVLLQGVP